jgi:TonB family protein
MPILALIAFLLFTLSTMPLSCDSSHGHVLGKTDNDFSHQVNSKAAQRRAEPLDLSQIKELIPIMPDSALAGEIRDRGVSFKSDKGLVNELKQIGAGQETTGVLTNFIGNQPPTVTLRSGKTQALAGEVVEISANASDPDTDPLDYVWTTDLGSIKGEGTHVELTTDEVPSGSPPAQVNVSVTVFDRRGGSSSARQQMVVRSPGPAASRPRLVEKRQDAGKPNQLIRATTELPLKTPEESQVESDPAMALKVTVDDDYAVITLTGTSGDKTKSSGSMNITVDISNPVLARKTVNGILTGFPCQVEIEPIENVSEHSLLEIPAIENEWGKLMVRVLPKNPKLPFYFAINWKAPDVPVQEGVTKSSTDAVNVKYEKAVIVKRVSPTFPRAARLERVSGSVLVLVDVDEQGNVAGARALDGPDSLREAALNSARQFKFRPARKDGQPTKSTEVIQFRFRL